MYKVKYYVNSQALRMLYHSLINSRAQYGIIAWGKAAPCHLQPISVVLNRAMRCLNTDKLLTNKVTIIYKMQKILQLKDLYNLEVSKFMYKYTASFAADAPRWIQTPSSDYPSTRDSVQKQVMLNALRNLTFIFAFT